MAYLIKYHKLSCSEARGFVKARRDEVFPNPGFMRQLNTYAESFAKIVEENEEKVVNTRKSTYRSKSLSKGSGGLEGIERAGGDGQYGFVSKFAGVMSYCRNYEKKMNAVVVNDNAIYVASVP